MQDRNEDSKPAAGYLIAEVDVTNPELYENYRKAAAPIAASYGGNYLVRAGRNEVREGPAIKGRLVIIEFPSYALARAFYDSPEYQEILSLRTENAISRIIIAEGSAGE